MQLKSRETQVKELTRRLRLLKTKYIDMAQKLHQAQKETYDWKVATTRTYGFNTSRVESVRSRNLYTTTPITKQMLNKGEIRSVSSRHLKEVLNNSDMLAPLLQTQKVQNTQRSDRNNITDRLLQTERNVTIPGRKFMTTQKLKMPYHQMHLDLRNIGGVSRSQNNSVIKVKPDTMNEQYKAALQQFIVDEPTMNQV